MSKYYDLDELFERYGQPCPMIGNAPGMITALIAMGAGTRSMRETVREQLLTLSSGPLARCRTCGGALSTVLFTNEEIDYLLAYAQCYCYDKLRAKVEAMYAEAPAVCASCGSTCRLPVWVDLGS